jgi:hypothetical protein
METLAMITIKSWQQRLALVAFGLGVSLFPMPAAAGEILDSLRWKNRVLILFAPSVADPEYEKINTDVEMESSEMDDRDLVIVRVLEHGASTAGAARLNDGDAEMLRKRFSITEGQMATLLIGKDGGLKLRRSGSVDIREIFALIDGMPMRQQEMREKNTGAP